MLEEFQFFYIFIKHFRTQLKMAQHTNFVKLSIMQIKILSFWLGQPSLLYEIKRQAWTNANPRSIHFWATLCEKTSILKSLITKVLLVLKEALKNVKPLIKKFKFKCYAFFAKTVITFWMHHLYIFIKLHN